MRRLANSFRRKTRETGSPCPARLGDQAGLAAVRFPGNSV
jgi:hypothetical protein